MLDEGNLQHNRFSNSNISNIYNFLEIDGEEEEDIEYEDETEEEEKEEDASENQCRE